MHCSRMRVPRGIVAFAFAAAVSVACDAGPASPAIGFTYNWGDDVLERFVQQDVDRAVAARGGPAIRLLSSREGGWQAFGATPMTAEVRRAQVLSDDPDVLAIVGPGGSREALQVAPLYAEAGLPVLVPTATSQLLDGAGAHLFRLAANDSVQGAFIAAFADSVLTATSVAVYHVPDEYGIGLAAGVTAAAAARGLEIRERTPVRLLQACGDAPGRRYYDDLVRALGLRGRPGAVILAQRTEEAACFTRALRARWPDLAIVAGDGVYLDDTFRTFAGDAANGTYLVAFWHPELAGATSRQFVRDFEAATGRAPRHGEAVFVDAVRLATAALLDGARTRDAVSAYLRTLGGSRPPFDGIIGPISFAAGAARPLYMTRVTAEGSTLLSGR